MRNPDYGWEPPPRPTAPSPPPRPVSLWDPPPARDPEPGTAAATAPWRKPPWYRRAWFVSLVVVAVFGTAGAVVGSQVP
jgi:hypothetical protein